MKKDSLIPPVVVLAIIILVGLVLRNCIFIWPVRLDFGACVKEQWFKATEKAVKFPSSK